MWTGNDAPLDEYGSIRIADRTQGPDEVRQRGDGPPGGQRPRSCASRTLKRDERPLACVLEEGESATEQAILDYLQPQICQVVA